METTDLKVSIIGAGNMGGAIARGLSKGTTVQASNIRVSDISADHLQALQTFAPEISISRTNAENHTGSEPMGQKRGLDTSVRLSCQMAILLQSIQLG
jgi:3-hydroxyacyl-CoA dehydrogenase